MAAVAIATLGPTQRKRGNRRSEELGGRRCLLRDSRVFSGTFFLSFDERRVSGVFSNGLVRFTEPRLIFALI